MQGQWLQASAEFDVPCEHVTPSARSSLCTNSTCHNNEMAGGLRRGREVEGFEAREGGEGVVNLQAVAVEVRHHVHNLEHV